MSFTVRRGTNFKMGADLLIDTTNAPCSRVEERSAWGGMWIGAWGSCQWNKMVWLKCGEEWSRGVRCLSNYRYSEYTMHPPPLGHAHTHWLGCIKVVQVLLENHRNVVTNAECTRPTSRNALINGLCLWQLRHPSHARNPLDDPCERPGRLIYLSVTMGSSAGRFPHGPVNRAQSLAAARGQQETTATTT